MDREHLDRIGLLYNQALERPREEWSTWLLAQSAGDEGLQQELQSLLNLTAVADDFLERGALAVAAESIARPDPGTLRSSLNHYQIVSKIGAGGMAEVYLAHDTKLNRDVAIKVPLPGFAHRQDGLVRFQREGQVLASLKHPKIASIYGSETDGNVTGLILELVEGETLHERIARGLTVTEALDIASQIAEALEAAHAQGIIHRDLKPANVKITRDGKVKVLDFGLARILDPKTATGHSDSIPSGYMVLGTLSYMPPEQARGSHVDARADVWSWGCVLYEMLTGRRAFAGPTPSHVISQILSADVDWSRLPKATPPQVVALLRRCLTANPQDRLQDISAARIELEEVRYRKAHEPAAHANWIPFLVGAFCIVAFLGVVMWPRETPTAPAPPALKATVPPAPPNTNPATPPAIPTPPSADKGAAPSPRPVLRTGFTTVNFDYNVSPDGSGYSGVLRDGDGGPAALAQISLPESVALDDEGNLYIEESRVPRIRKVTPSGIIMTVAGNGTIGFSGDGGPATLAQFSLPTYSPSSIAVAGDGILYIPDSENHRVRRVARNGIITTVAGTGVPGFNGDGRPAVSAQLYNPAQLAVDRAGNLYILDIGQGPVIGARIRKVTPDGVIHTVAGNGVFGLAQDGIPATAASFRYPYAIAVDGSGNLYVADTANAFIRKVDTKGIIRTIAGNGRRNPLGTAPPTPDGPASTTSLLLSGLAFDRADNLYFTDGNRVRRLLPDGWITTVAGNGNRGVGGDGGPALQAEMMSAMSIAFDRFDNLYIVDRVGFRVRKVSADGTINTVIGSSNPSQDTRRGVIRGGEGLAYLELYQYKPGGPITQPSVIYQTPLDYTDEARRLGINGDVILEAIIRKDGTVQVTRLLQSLDRKLDDAVKQALQEWRFQPSILITRRGPVDVLVNIHVSFQLQ
jgi:TonB family protein